MATSKKTTRGKAQPATKAKKPRKIAPRAAPVDEFSAAGGMPTVPAGLPASDFSREHHDAMRELTWGEFDRHLQTLAREVARTFHPDAVVGLVHGGVFVGGALASALKAEFYPVRITSRSRSREQGRALEFSEDLPGELEGKRLLIVDDVASSGDSIEFATRLARAQGVKAIKSAALIARPGRFEPDFVALTSNEFFVFPWDYQDVVDDRRFETGDAPAPKKRSRKT